MATRVTLTNADIPFFTKLIGRKRKFWMAYTGFFGAALLRVERKGDWWYVVPGAGRKDGWAPEPLLHCFACRELVTLYAHIMNDGRRGFDYKLIGPPIKTVGRPAPDLTMLEAAVAKARPDAKKVKFDMNDYSGLFDAA